MLLLPEGRKGETWEAFKKERSVGNLGWMDKKSCEALSTSFRCRTKWKRQTAVGLELLAEAGNYAAFQRLYGGPPYGCWPYPGAAPGAVPVAPSTADLYYRQAAAAAAAVSTLQKPLPYRLYPGAGIGLGLPGPSSASPHLPAPVGSALGSLSSYYNSHRSPQSPPQSPPPVSRPSSEEEDSSPRV